jgi:Mn2+/Fe2+ NRAMP family transporter
MSNFRLNNPIVRFFKNVIGPSAIVAAGMIGAGAVSTRLLAGTWFRMELLWSALYVIPMVIFTLDSASRVGIMSNHRGMLEMVKNDIHWTLAWFMFIPTFLLNIIVNMSQMSVMIEAAYGALGITMPADTEAAGIIITMLILVVITLVLVLFGGYKRIEKLMTGLLLLILAAFIIVAVKGLMDWKTWIELAKGLIPKIPENLPVVGTEKVRSGFIQLMAISGQALPASVFLSYGYFTSNAEYKAADLKRSFWKSVQNFGVIWGLFSVVVVVAGATALNSVYTDPATLHFSQIDSVVGAGEVITPALPGVISFLAPRIFSLGLLAAAFTTLISVAMLMTYFTLDIVGKDWKFKEKNKGFQWAFGLWIAVPAMLAPLWKLPSLIKAIFAMAGNLILAPLAVGIIIYFINKKSYMGEFKANIGRNIVLIITLLYTLFILFYKIM